MMSTRFWMASLVVMASSGLMMADPTGVSDGDRVVFFGDKTVSYPGFGVFVENFIRVKHPDSKARFWHVGSRGYDRLTVADDMLEELVLPTKPTVVVLSWGLGEGDSKAPNEARAKSFGEHYRKIIEKCQAAGAKVFAVTPPSPNIAKKTILRVNRYDESVQQIASAVVSAAQATGAVVIDWNSATRQLRESKPSVELVDKDGLLPTGMSKSIVAKLIFEAWNLEPMKVTIDLDWKTRSVSSNEGSVSVTPVSDTVVHLELKDFPMPIYTGRRDQAFSDAMACAGYCRMLLKVNNLPGGGVALTEPGSRMRPMRVPADRLQAGLNLASRSPLLYTEAFKKFYDQVSTKNFRFSETIRWVDQNLKEQAPEPELVESYHTYVLSQKQYHEGLVKVIARTPRTIDMILELSLIPGPK